MSNVPAHSVARDGRKVCDHGPLSATECDELGFLTVVP